MALPNRLQELGKAIPHFNNYDSNPNHINSNNSILKQGDKQGTIDNIMGAMEIMVMHDDYMRNQDKNYKASKEDDERFNTYKKQLKDMGVSFDQFRGWYLDRHPTPEMQAWDKAGKMMDNYLKDKLGVNNQNNVIGTNKIGTNNNTQSNGFINPNTQRKGKKLRFSKPDNRVVL